VDRNSQPGQFTCLETGGQQEGGRACGNVRILSNGDGGKRAVIGTEISTHRGGGGISLKH